jgi:hypothetical protein
MRWTSTDAYSKNAVRERFEYFLARAVTDGSADAAVRPSNIANSILTNGLRLFVDREPGLRRVDVPVVYQDGSRGAPFPLRAFSMTDHVPDTWRTFRFTLMSIRHVEMDAIVDGAWFRNIKISRPRVAGHTDDLAFETSLVQLRQLASGGPTLIYLYQTGFEPAIVGFYRALVHQLLDEPGSIAVVPCFYHARGEFSKGTAWATS